MTTLLRAVIIGINEYADKRCDEQSRLKFAQADAEEMARVLRTSPALRVEHIDTHTNGGATRKKVLDSLHSVFTDRLPGQSTIALFYFSGHGLHNPKDDRIWLCCSDVDFSDPNVGGIRLNDIYEMLMRSSAECAIAIIDACYSGGIIDTGYFYTHMSPAEHAKRAIEALRAPGGKAMAVFAACRENKAAREDNTNKHGIYTQALLKGWRDGEARGSDGNVTPWSLADYLANHFAGDRQVPRASIVASKPVILWHGSPRPSNSQEPPPQHIELSDNIITFEPGRSRIPRNKEKKPSKFLKWLREDSSK